MKQAAIAIGLAAGILFGLLASATQWPFLLAAAAGVKPLGTLFVNAIRMAVIPLVAVTIFSGVASLGSPRKLGRLGGLTLLFFWATTVAGIVLGMLAMEAAQLVWTPALHVEAASSGRAPELPGMVDFLVGLIPANPFAAASEGALLPLIVFSALLAAAAAALPAEQRNPLISLAEAAAAALIQLVHWILWTAPLGVFALAAPVAAQSGWETLQGLAVFVVAVIAGLAALVGGVYLPLVWTLGKLRPAAFLKACLGPQAIAFSTTSSAASLPAMLEAAQRDLRLQPASSTLALSLGASLNRAGSALFQGAAVVFLASAYGVPIPPEGLAGALLATFLVSLTVAPVPSASVVTLAPALETVGVPLAGLALLLGVDRIPDMFRTAVNVTGSMAAAAVVDQPEDPEPSRN